MCKKAILLLFSFWNLTSIAQITLISDTSAHGNSSQKFVFERLNKSSTKKISGSTGITVRLSLGDTNVKVYGQLINADSETITIKPYWKVNSLKTENHTFTEAFDYDNSVMIFDVLHIKSIKYENNFMLILGSIGAISLANTLIGAPLIAIDKNSPDNFNVSRYKTVALSSLAGSVILLTISIFSDNRKDAYRLKPTLVRKSQ